ncbi:MAG TPA: hypothetical protein VMP86_02675 [Candidatus Binatia bacterium]|nr:hypothetical protein [Candidatus Binatia bacterium]
MRRLTLLLAAVTLLTTACVDDSRPTTCDEPRVELELDLGAEALTPDAPAVCRDQEVTLRIASEVDGVIHIHGYDAVVPATEVSAGDVLQLTFTAARSGQFPIELHPADDPRGVSVGVFTVHEP